VGLPLSQKNIRLGEINRLDMLERHDRLDGVDRLDRLDGLDRFDRLHRTRKWGEQVRSLNIWQGFYGDQKANQVQ
jgi:hypothetical protein